MRPRRSCPSSASAGMEPRAPRLLGRHPVQFYLGVLGAAAKYRKTIQVSVPAILRIKEDAAIAVSVMWTIWSSRNKYKHGEIVYQPLKSMELVDEHIKSLEVPAQVTTSREGETQKWSRPALNWLKINCDGALNMERGGAAIGVVVRDDLGFFVAAEGRRYEHVFDPGITELLACRDAIFLAKTRGWTHVELETDCLSVVSAWRNNEMQRAAGYQIMLEMKDCISSFQGFTFNFVRRTANKAAHACAQMVSTYDEFERMLQDSDATPMSLPLPFLKSITHDFSSDLVLGKGGFGVVYKGILRSGKNIAVKKLSDIHVTEEAFRKEAIILLRIKNKNIVQFVGYCAESKWEAIDVPIENGSGNLRFAEVWTRLLCFEYVPNQSLDKHISEASSGLEWNTRYNIINGICNGLHFLHDERNIIHLDLKPQNILMDSTMIPKIADFGMSRLFGEKQSRIITETLTGTRGYMAPEYFDHGVLSKKSDIFGLGVIIIEIITGHVNYPYFHEDSPHSTTTSLLQFTEKVIGSWRKSFIRKGMYKQMEIYTQQVTKCIAIALKCVDPSMERRPTVKDIIQMLNTVDQVSINSSEPLDVHPVELFFPVESNKAVTCSLYLTNDKDNYMVYRLMQKTYEKKCFLKLPLYGIVPPRCSYTIFVTTAQKKNLAEEREVNLILQTIIIDDDTQVYRRLSGEKFDMYLEKAKTLQNGVHMVALKAVYAPQGKTTSEVVSRMLRVLMEQIMERTREEWLYSLDVCQTEPLILTGYRHGYIDIWNYATQKLMGSVRTGDCTLWSVKFIERKEWFVAGSRDGLICVYNYQTGGDEIKSFYASQPHYFPLTSLVVHPTKPYVLAACGVCIKLWDWEKNWECIHTYEKQVHHTFNLRFNPMDTESFVGASNNNTEKIWTLDSVEPKYTLSGNWNKPCCLDFFTRDDRQYLITVADDRRAKIWDIQTQACIYTLEGFMSQVTSVVSHPSIPLIITGSENGDIHLWSATNFRLKRMISTGVSNSLCEVRLMGPRRVLIAQGLALWMMEINDDEEDIEDF